MELEVSFSNECNLECVICSGFNSTAISNRVKNYNINLPIKSHNQWDKSDEFKKEIEHNYNTITSISFTGGEPLLHSNTMQTLDYLISHNVSKDIELKFSTNATHIPEDFENKIKQFKRVRICISIDAVGDVLEYIRWPCVWSDIDNNIMTLKQMEMKNENVQISISSFMYSLNVMEMHKLFSYAALHNIDITLQPLTHSNNEKYLNVHMLSSRDRNLAATMIENVLNIFPYIRWEHGVGEVRTFLKNDVKVDSIQYEYFRQVVEYWDSHRPVKFLDQFPYLEYLLTDK